MAWIAVDKDGEIYKYESKPWRIKEEFVDKVTTAWDELVSDEECKRLTGKVLTWEDEPVEI